MKPDIPASPPTSKIDVSIIMAAFNSERFIEEAVLSCLAQTGVTLELIIVDDGSNSDLRPLIEDIAGNDARVILLTSEQNYGPAHARNCALRVAQGEYIAIVDSDDFIVPDRLSGLIEKARTSGADIIVDNLIEFSDAEQGRHEQAFLTGEDGRYGREISLTDFMRSGIQYDGSRCYGYLKPVIKRSALTRIGSAYREALRTAEDYYLIADLLRSGARMWFAPQIGYYYRRHAGSLTYRAAVAHLNTIAETERSFRELGVPALTSEQVHWSKQRSRLFRRMYRFEKIANALKQKRYLEALATSLRQPFDIPSQIFRAATIAFQKATRA